KDASYVITRISNLFGEGAAKHLDVYVDVNGSAKYRQYSDTFLQKSPREAGISHFDGPLTAGPQTIDWKLSAGKRLQLGSSPNRIETCIGTMDADHKCWVVVCSDNGDREQPAFPLLFPKVTVEFPPKVDGGQPVTEIFRLDKFCCGA